MYRRLARIKLAADGERLVGLWLEGQKYFAGTVKEEMTEAPELGIFKNTKDWLDRYFAGKKPEPSELLLAPLGGGIQAGCMGKSSVRSPYGQLTTYGDIAKKMAERMNRVTMSAQAVGGAVGHNPISIIIPCHRVVGTTGSLTGYAGGVDKKIWLLKHEGVDMEGLFIPEKGTAL